jgi:uncharacterized protein with PQ loop repeat
MPLTLAGADSSVVAAAEVFAWAGGGFGVLLSWPQAWRLWVDREHAGLSLSASVLGFVAPVAWVAYGVAQRSLPQIVTNLLVVLGGAAVLAGQVRRARPDTRRWLPLTVASLTLTLGLFAYAPAATVGWLAGLVTLASTLPQVVLLLRARMRGPVDARGVARARWVLSLSCNSAWLVYGVLRGDVVIATTALVIALLSAAVLVLLAGATKGAPCPAGELEPSVATGAG